MLIEDRKFIEANVGSYKIMLVGDHASLRRNFGPMLAEMTDVMVAGECNNVLDLLSPFENPFSHIIFFSPSLIDPAGIETIRKVKMVGPDLKVMILTLMKDKENLRHALSAWVEGYLFAGDADVKISVAIDAIQRGQVYISHGLLEDLSDDWVETCRDNWKPFPKLLTGREKEILRFIAEGRSSKKIGGLLFVSARTVEHHRSNVMSKLNLKNTASLIKYAVCQGYLA